MDGSFGTFNSFVLVSVNWHECSPPSLPPSLLLSLCVCVGVPLCILCVSVPFSFFSFALWLLRECLGAMLSLMQDLEWACFYGLLLHRGVLLGWKSSLPPFSHFHRTSFQLKIFAMQKFLCMCVSFSLFSFSLWLLGEGLVAILSLV